MLGVQIPGSNPGSTRVLVTQRRTLLQRPLYQIDKFPGTPSYAPHLRTKESHVYHKPQSLFYDQRLKIGNGAIRHSRHNNRGLVNNLRSTMQRIQARDFRMRIIGIDLTHARRWDTIDDSLVDLPSLDLNGIISNDEMSAFSSIGIAYAGREGGDIVANDEADISRDLIAGDFGQCSGYTADTTAPIMEAPRVVLAAVEIAAAPAATEPATAVPLKCPY